MGRGVSHPGMWGMGSLFSTVRLQGPSSVAPGHPWTSGQSLRTGCDKAAVQLSGLMALPWHQQPQTVVSRVCSMSQQQTWSSLVPSLPEAVGGKLIREQKNYFCWLRSCTFITAVGIKRALYPDYSCIANNSGVLYAGSCFQLHPALQLC